MLYRLFRRTTNHTVYAVIFRHLGDVLRRANVTQNEVIPEQEKDSDQPRQNEDLLPDRGATSVTWTWFGYEKSDAPKKTVVCKLCRHTWSFYINYLFIEFTFLWSNMQENIPP